jgi:4-alpha-glucanotransferase
VAVAAAAARLGIEVERHMFRQFLFFRQWQNLRRAAERRGIHIIGDVPIFVAPDSVDVWTGPDLFRLAEDHRPSVVAGVPPDYFSPTGQLWGNPLYDWEAHAADGYRWWIERIRHTFETVDVARIDHFRGFVDYWEIPAGAPTAVTGRWVDGPGRAVFDAIEAALGTLPIIAEDLGELHPAVPALRDELGFPGMKILQFAYDAAQENDFRPERYPENCIAYTGTHDNDTAVGWYRSASWSERLLARRELNAWGPARTIARAMIRAAWRSRAVLAVAPLQDLLGLDSRARMNIPSTASGNWRWRLGSGPPRRLAEWLRSVNEGTERLA